MLTAKASSRGTTAITSPLLIARVANTPRVADAAGDADFAAALAFAAPSATPTRTPFTCTGTGKNQKAHSCNQCA